MGLQRGHGIGWLLWRWICCGLAMLAGLSVASADDLAECNAAAIEPNEGIAACTRIIGAGALRGHDPAVVYRNRGAGRYTRHQEDEAIADFTRAIALDPNYASAYRDRGRALGRKSELNGAIADFNEALRLNPTAAFLYNDRGLVWRMKGDLDRAFADFGSAIRLDSDMAAAYRNRGYANRKGAFDLAIADFNQLIGLNPRDITAFVERGNAWKGKHDTDRAMADYDSAIRDQLQLGNPDRPDGRHGAFHARIRVEPQGSDRRFDCGLQ